MSRWNLQPTEMHADTLRSCIERLHGEANCVAQKGGEEGPVGALWLDRAAAVVRELLTAHELGAAANARGGPDVQLEVAEEVIVGTVRYSIDTWAGGLADVAKENIISSLRRVLAERVPARSDKASEERRIEERLVVTDLCDMHAFHREGRLGAVLRRAINFIEGEECFPSYARTSGPETASVELAPLAARIAKGRAKYANGCTVLSLIDEAGEVAHAVNKYEPEDRIRDELLDVAAVAMRLYFGEIDRGLEMDGLVQRRRERAKPRVSAAEWDANLIAARKCLPDPAARQHVEKVYGPRPTTDETSDRATAPGSRGGSKGTHGEVAPGDQAVAAEPNASPACTPGRLAAKMCAWWDEEYDDSNPYPMPATCSKPATHFSCCYGNAGPNVCEEHKCRCKQPAAAPDAGDTGGGS